MVNPTNKGPFKAGTIISGANLESAVPVQPAGSVAQTLKAAQEAFIKEQEMQPRELPDKPLEIPAAVDLASLSAERQQSILSAIEQYKSVMPPKPEKAPDKEVDLRTQKVEPAKTAPTTPEQTTSATGATLPPAHCQHCGWQLSRPDPEEPEDFDKLSFLQSMLGLSKFYKSYSLLGGNLVITFRTLTNEELDACFTQITHDINAGLVLDSDHYLRTLSDYKLCLSLSRIEIGSVVKNLPDLNGYKTDALPPRATKLKLIVPYIYDHVLVQAPFRQAAASACLRFERLAAKLADHMDDPNFWPAIGGQP